jgi:hypothetical protein
LKWLALVGGACAVTAVIHPRLARSADHLDAPATMAEPTADVNDVFAFLDKPGDPTTNVIFAMTVYPAAPADAKFSDTVQYVLHTQSGAAFGQTTTDFNIICQFDAAQVASCWAGANEYVTGNASGEAGLTSASGKLKVFAGLRADPFFFNLDGFKHAVSTVDTAVAGGSVNTNDAGCPLLPPGYGTDILQPQLNHTDGGAPVDFFASLRTLAIVVQVDKTLVSGGGPVISVWASTNRKGQ